MIIALDYDQTYTADPAFWNEVVLIGINRGHRFVCVTGRERPPRPEEPAIPMPVICCNGGEFKSRAAARAGVKIDVWIDDCPGMIGPARILDFGDAA